MVEELRVLTEAPRKADGYWMVSYTYPGWASRAETREQGPILQASFTKEQCPEIESLKKGNVVVVVKDEDDNVKSLRFILDRFPCMRTLEEIADKIAELNKADLDQTPVDEVQYGLFWLDWVLGVKEHTTKLRKVKA